MPVSPADFYAYSQATGVQVPDSPEERAQLAPQVLQFRRNQLKQPQEQGFDPMSMGVGIGLALAGAGAGALALRGRNKIPKSTKTTGQSGAKVKDLSRVMNVGKSKEPTRQDVYQSDLASQVDEAAQVISQNALTDFQERQAPAISDQQINAAGSGEDQMTGRVRQQLQRNEDLNLMQVDALEDINQQVAPSSSDAPITQAAAQTADGLPVDQAEGISSQPTPAVKNFIIDQRRKVWDEMANDYDYDPIKYPAPTHARVEAELAKRLGPGAYKFGPSFSANRQAMETYAMTGDPRVVAKEFGLSPVMFETFENMPEEKARVFESARPMSTEGYPSENLTPVIEKTGIKVNVPGVGEVDLADLRKPVLTESAATSAEDFYQNQISKRKNWITGVETDIAEKYERINEIKRQEIVGQLEKVETYLGQYVNQGNTKMANSMRARKQKLESQFEDPSTYTPKDPAVYAEDNLLKARLRGAQNKAQEMLTETGDIKKYPTTIDWSGGTPRVFGEQDPLTGEFIPETMELRSDRRVLDTTPKGGGGRNVAEYTAGEHTDEEIRNIQGGGRIRDYDLETGAATSPWEGDRTQTGREVDIYGVRLSGQKKADPKVRPSESQYTKQEIANEALRLSSAAKEGDVPLPPTYEDVIESLGSQPKTEAARRSVLMSEAVRKAARQRAERGQLTIPSKQLTIPGLTGYDVRQRKSPADIEAQQLESYMEKRMAGQSTPWTSKSKEAIQPRLPGVTGYYAYPQRKSPADIAAQQLESYMEKRMIGRSTPLTSQAVIQPKLF